MVQNATNLTPLTGCEVAKEIKFYELVRLGKLIGIRILSGPTFVVKAVGLIL
jgi:hypothetical protein